MQKWIHRARTSGGGENECEPVKYGFVFVSDRLTIWFETFYPITERGQRYRTKQYNENCKMRDGSYPSNLKQLRPGIQVQNLNCLDTELESICYLTHRQRSKTDSTQPWKKVSCNGKSATRQDNEIWVNSESKNKHRRCLSDGRNWTFLSKDSRCL